MEETKTSVFVTAVCKVRKFGLKTDFYYNVVSSLNPIIVTDDIDENLRRINEVLAQTANTQGYDIESIDENSIRFGRIIQRT